MNIKESFERVGFTPEEKMDLTARLERAAEQEDNMTRATKQRIKKISGGMIFGIAAAVMMTAGALAAVVSPGLHTWFNPASSGASQVVEDGIYRLDRSETYNGWTVTLEECMGDETSVYIWVDVTAPEGTRLTAPENGGFQARAWVDFEGAAGGCSAQYLPDTEPADNRISFVIRSDQSGESPRGQTATVTLGPITDYWTDTVVTSESVNDGWHEDSGVAAAIRDYQWVFEDVKLDFPDQTIRLMPNVEIPYLDGTVTITRLDISPLNMYVRLEGGSCDVYAEHMEQGKTLVSDTPISGETQDSGDKILIIITSPEDGTVTSQDEPKTGMDLWLQEKHRMSKALTVSLTMQDGTELELNGISGRPGYAEGINGPKTPYVEQTTPYSRVYNSPVNALDPAQVDHVVVCGVDIPVKATPAES